MSSGPFNRPDSAALARARFYAILDSGYVPRERWKMTCAALIAGGAAIVQVRAKQETSTERAALVEEILPAFAAATTAGCAQPLLVINDDVELCRAIPGAGLHIGQDDTPPIRARGLIGPDRVLGLSTHSWEQATAAQSLPPGVIDYFAVGPVFPTQTKPDYPPVGLALVSRVAAAAPALPWFVIGGVTRANIGTVARAGARRVVIVSDVLTAADPTEAVRAAIATLVQA